MERIFRGEKMLSRLEREGRIGDVRDCDRALIAFLDGRTGNDYNWESVVNGEKLVWIAGTDEIFEGKKFEGAYVATCDCE